MITIPLTQGKNATIDEGDATLVSTRPWRAVQTHPGKWYAVTKIAGRNVYLHHFIFGPGMKDHRDGNGLNNCRNNVRACTHAQNSFNRRKTHGSSQFKGVCWLTRERRWIAQIEVAGKNRRIGSFRDERAAADAYRAAAAAAFGEFASS